MNNLSHTSAGWWIRFCEFIIPKSFVKLEPLLACITFLQLHGLMMCRIWRRCRYLTMETASTVAWGAAFLLNYWRHHPKLGLPMSRSKRRPDVSSCECQNNYFAELNLFPHRLYIFQVQLISCTSVEGHDFATQGKMHQMQSEQIVFSRLFCTRISRKRKNEFVFGYEFWAFLYIHFTL